ncbi:MAG: sulfatase-like hydrolase/transferase [Halobacteriales archaeon]
MPDRPNVLFLMDDEHRADVLGYAGDDTVRTPTIDRLAETGVVFENAYTPSPRCVPARQCMMSGELPRTCGCEVYGEDLPPESMTWARRLAQYAYGTVAAGKLHHPGPDKAQGWQTLIGKQGGCNVETAADAPEVSGSDRPGRDKWTDAKEVRRAGTGKPDVGWKDNTDEYRVRGALDYIEGKYLDPHYDRESPDSPVALKVSLSQPHYPYLTTEEKFRYYLDRVDPYDDEAEVAFDDHAFLGARRLEVGYDGFGMGREGDVSPREIRRATAAYYGMIETVDEYYGEVLDALEEAGRDLDDWIVVVTSDHGEMLGQHGVWEKGHFFEGSARVPLVIRWPERFDPGVVSENVSLCDLFATLCELTGTPVPADHTLDSRSLVPLLEGRNDDWLDAHDDEAVSAYGDDLMIKRGDLKYIHAAEDRDVLFDLDADPGETENRIEDPDYADAVDEFRVRRDELGYGPNADPGYHDAGYTPGVGL